jgi:hypothetical protein
MFWAVSMPPCGHADVEQDHGEVVVDELLEGFAAVAGFEDLVLRAFEDGPEGQAVGVRVVDDEDLGRGGGWRWTTTIFEVLSVMLLPSLFSPLGVLVPKKSREERNCYANSRGKPPVLSGKSLGPGSF